MDCSRPGSDGVDYPRLHSMRAEPNRAQVTGLDCSRPQASPSVAHRSQSTTPRVQTQSVDRPQLHSSVVDRNLLHAAPIGDDWPQSTAVEAHRWGATPWEEASPR